jgi:hypothetical protein
MPFAETAAVITSLKTAFDLLKGIRKITQDMEITEKVVELQSVIISLQANILSMQAEHEELLNLKTDLEKKLMEYEKWDKEKTNYALTEISAGVFVYSRKKDQKPSEPDHWLCTKCFEDKRKSILQSRSSSLYFCPQCGTELSLRDRQPPYTPPRGGRMRGI